MVEGPDGVVSLLVGLNQREAKQRRLVKIEAAAVLGLLILLQLTRHNGRRFTTRVEPLKWEVHLPAHDLHWLLESLTIKRGAQNRVPLECLLPGLFEGRDVQTPVERTTRLQDVRGR